MKCVIRWDVGFRTDCGVSLGIRSQGRSGHEETFRAVTGQSCRVSQLGNRNCHFAGDYCGDMAVVDRVGAYVYGFGGTQRGESVNDQGIGHG